MPTGSSWAPGGGAGSPGYRPGSERRGQHGQEPWLQGLEQIEPAAAGKGDLEHDGIERLVGEPGERFVGVGGDGDPRAPPSRRSCLG